MTDATNGPAGETQQTTATQSTVLTDGGSNGESGIKVAGPLSEDNRALVEAKKWAGEDGSLDLNKIADGYRNLETHSSKALALPGEGSTKEDWDKFYSKLGRPEKPDGYELKLNREAIPENFPYDEKSAIEFRTWAHEAGLTPAQAQTLHDKFVGYQAGSYTSMVEDRAQREAAAHREITTEWGAVESEGYKQKVELASRAIHQLGLKDALVAGNMISADGAILDAKIAKAFAKVGKELYAEDTMATTAGGVLVNPFSDGPTFNLTKQGEILRSDPKKAASLMRAAGKNPAEFGLTG